MSFPPRRHRFRRPKPSLIHRVAALAILAMCMVSILTPLAGPASAGPDLDIDLGITDCPEGKVWDADQGKCVRAISVQTEDETGPTIPVDPSIPVTPPAEPTETPVIQVEERDQTPPTIPINPDIDLIETPDAGATGTVTINKHRCPAGFDTAAASYYDLAAACTESPDGILFGISDGASEIATGTTGDAFPGGFVVSGLPLEGTAIYEKNVPDGGTSVIFCDGYTDDEGGPSNWENFETAENQVFYDFGEAPNLYCDWFNLVPAAAGSATVIIAKHACPETYDATAEDYYDLALNCPEMADGIEFGVSDGATEIATATTGSAFPGGLQIDGLPAGATSIYEKDVPDTMYSIVFCAGMLPTDNDGADFVKMSLPDANQVFYILAENETLTCDWFNVYHPMETGYGDVTIYKWLCPAGFDPNAQGADPGATCTEPMDGVTFTMERPGMDPLVSTTGDSIPGAVSFGGQEAGDYTITESLPQGFETAFVWSCTGGSTAGVHPSPLAVGTSLTLTVAAGDAIACNWYNVPETDPEHGHLTVIKYTCAGPVFVSEIDCEIHEYGVTFDLLAWDGNGWVAMDTQTTSGNGTIAWTNLPAGSYRLAEHDDEPCHVVTSSGDADWNVAVEAGQETEVEVYNCTEPGETPVPGKAPIKYPNTGVAPATEPVDPAPAGE